MQLTTHTVAMYVAITLPMIILICIKFYNSNTSIATSYLDTVQVSDKFNTTHKTCMSHACPHEGIYVCMHVRTYMHV